MNQAELDSIWNYYLSIEQDLAATSRYIEPSRQENVYSFEFSKLLVLSCTEAEAVFKAICKAITEKECGNIGEYKEVILGSFPRIVTAEVSIPRWGQVIRPFEGWDTGKLEWWDAYGAVKHNRGSNFESASYKNAVYALSALYILIFYLAKTHNIRITDTKSTYIVSAYAFRLFACAPTKQLPDFDNPNSINKPFEKVEDTAKIEASNTEPMELHDGDIWIQTE